MPYRTPSGALYDSGDYEACLDDALELARWDERRSEAEAARADGRLVGVGLACVVEPSISNMGYITLAQTAVERAQTLPKSGNAEGALVQINPLGGDHRPPRDDAARAGASHRLRAGRRRRARVRPGDVEVLAEMDTATFPGRWPRGTTRPDSRASAWVPCARPPESCARRSTRSATHWRPGAVAPPRRRHRPLESGVAARRDGAGSDGDGVLGDPEPRSSRRGGPGRLVRRARLPRRRRRRRGRSRTRARSTCSTTSPFTTPAGSSTRCSPTARSCGGFAHGAGVALLERHVHDESGNLMTAPSSTTSLRPRPTCRRCGSATARRRRRSPPSAPRVSARETR